MKKGPSLSTAPTSMPKASAGGKRFGYLLTAVINAAALYVVTHLLAWDLLSFLTESFEDVVPIISIAIGATIAVNLVYVVFDPPWFKSAAQVVVAIVGIVASVRLYQTFPFDFSESSFDWSTVARVVLILAVVGNAVSVILELAKLAKEGQRL